MLQEIRDRAIERTDAHTVTLCDEALDYARRMSARLVEYKDEVSKYRAVS